ncbi:MAG: dTMP kinase [Syntrophomonadaceae bacterium]|nr:dTMP kinase [Syntrophomonadaceae bacterium]
MSRRGLFISLEGIDGCGKSSLKMELQEFLQPYLPVSIREPGSTVISEQIRQLLLDCRNDTIGDRTEAMLYASARCQLVDEIIRPALEAGRLIVADRYIDSTIAYQGYGRGIQLDFLYNLNQLCTGGIEPDLTLLLDLDPRTALVRRADGRPDRLEQEGLQFQTRVREGYLQIARTNPARVKVIDASQPQSLVKGRAIEYIKELMQERSWPE